MRVRSRSRARVWSRIWRGAALLSVVAILVGAVEPAAHAQQLLEPPRARQGYYFGLGYYFASTHVWEDGEDWNVWPGTALSFRMGEMITRRFGMGLQINPSGTTTGQGQNASFGGLELEAQWELARNLALYGGVGVDVVSLSAKNGSDKTTRGTVGAGYSLGLSYDWFFTNRRSGGWALAPTAQVRFVPGNTAAAFMGLFGVQIAYWTGLPRNQLDLPPDEAFQRK